MDDIEELHKNACINKAKTYIDPKSGYSVFTAYFLQNRGKCCGSKCRHCPYNWINVKNQNIYQELPLQHKVNVP